MNEHIATAARAAAKEEVKARSIARQVKDDALIDEKVRIACEPIKAYVNELHAEISRLQARLAESEKALSADIAAVRAELAAITP